MFQSILHLCFSELSPNNASYYGNRAACYIMLNQYKDALADVRKALEIDPKFVKVSKLI